MSFLLGYCFTQIILAGFWAGHMVTYGSAELPIFGKIDTRTDSYVLAYRKEVLFDQASAKPTLLFQQQTCAVRMTPVLSIHSSLPDSSAKKLPLVWPKFSYHKKLKSWQGKWLSFFGEEDEDNDGHPGISIHVAAPLCSGQVYTQTQSQTEATGFLSKEALALFFKGKIEVSMEQIILGGSHFCLQLGAKYSVQKLQGFFAYKELSKDKIIQCEDLDINHWPVQIDKEEIERRLSLNDI